MTGVIAGRPGRDVPARGVVQLELDLFGADPGRIPRILGGAGRRARPMPAPRRGAADRRRSHRRRYNPGISGSSASRIDG
jgi:hypothetical protein